MKKQENIKFNLLKINTEEFAKFEENFELNVEQKNNYSFGFNFDNNKRLLFWGFEIESSCNSNLFLKGKFSFVFQFSIDSWESLKQKDQIVFPKNLIAHVSMLSVGTIRGILYEKLSKLSTPLSNYILPLINLSEIITEDVVINLNDTEAE